jgi:hypothetical protein
MYYICYMDCTIIKFIKEEGQIIGVLLQIDNGETQYLTIEEHNTFQNKKDGRQIRISHH